MTKSGKNLKKLNRSDLLELLIEHSKEIECLRNKLSDAVAECVDLELRCDELAKRNAELEQAHAEREAANEESLRHVMAGASQAAEHVVEQGQLEADSIIANARREAEALIREANEEAAIIRKYAKLILTDAKSEAGDVERAAKRSSDELLAETRRICADLVGQAQAEINALFDEADRKASEGWK